MKNGFYWWTMISVSVALISCKKEDNPNPGGTISAVSVLNDLVNFETVYDTAMLKDDFNGLPNSLGLEDFTVEDNATLHAYYYTEQYSTVQIDPFYTYFRSSINISNRASVGLPPGAGMYNLYPSSFGKAAYKFFPYSNILNSIQNEGGPQFGSLRSLAVNTDTELYFETAGFLGLVDVAYRYIVYNAFSQSGMGVNHGAFTRLSNGSAIGIGAQYEMFYGPATIGNAICVYDVVKDNSNNEIFYSLAVNLDSVFVVQYNYTNFGTSMVDPTYSTSRINQMQQAAPVALTDVITLRHYSPNGKKVAFGILNKFTLIANTYVYDYESNTLSQNLSNVNLDYAGSTELHADLDEQGNICYAGFAANGTNQNGTSIYKKTGPGAAELIGDDNFLKSGTVVGLKSLNDRIYIAVIAEQTENNAHQISFLRTK